MELNSKGYWDARFSSGDWQSRGGALKEKAVQRICITVPYEEPLNSEHVRRYSSGHFEIVLSGSAEHVFLAKYWSEYGRRHLHLHLKNLGRSLRGKPLRPRKMQIMFRLDLI